MTTDSPYETGFLEEIVNCHFKSTMNYILFQAGGSLTHTGSLDPPSKITYSISLRRGSTTNYNKDVQSTSSATAEQWYSFAKPAGQFNFADGGPFGYNTVEDAAADFFPNLFTVPILRAQGIPPVIVFPGATNPMTQQQEAVAHAAYVNAAAPGTLISGIFAIRHAPATWAAEATRAYEGTRFFAETIIIGFEDVGNVVFDISMSGTSGGDPDLVNSGGSAEVFQNVTIKPSLITPANLQAQYFPDWTIRPNAPITAGSFKVVTDTSGTLTGTKGSLYISSPGWHD